CRVAQTWRTIRLERVRVRPFFCGPVRRPVPGRARPAHRSLRRRRQSSRPHPRRRRDELALVGNEERVARPTRRRWPRAGGTLRRLRRRTVHRRQPRVRLRKPALKVLSKRRPPLKINPAPAVPEWRGSLRGIVALGPRSYDCAVEAHLELAYDGAIVAVPLWAGRL